MEEVNNWNVFKLPTFDDEYRTYRNERTH